MKISLFFGKNHYAKYIEYDNIYVTRWSIKKVVARVLAGVVILGFVALAVFMRYFEYTAPPLKVDAPLGVWWWSQENDSQWLSFAKQNGVDEIYYCDCAMDTDTAQFVRKANNLGMKVYLLAGEYDWIEDKSSLDMLLDRYRAYQVEYSQSAFEGVHLDIEPHQYEDFGDKRSTYLTQYAVLVQAIVQENPDISFDFDIPFWFDDIVTLDSQSKPLYQFVLDYADRVFVMSYRDNVDKILSCAQDEMAYAGVLDKDIFLSVETKANSNASITFYEEGKMTLNNAIAELLSRTAQDIGISIHNIKSWFMLKEC